MTDRKKLLMRATSLILFIFLVNLAAQKFYWYYTIWYFDMPMHFLGGLWVFMALIWLAFKEEINFSLILKVLLGVFLVGILWEIFEVLVNNQLAQNPFNLLDTLSDLFFDLAGGIFASIYFLRKKIILKTENKL